MTLVIIWAQRPVSSFLSPCCCILHCHPTSVFLFSCYPVVPSLDVIHNPSHHHPLPLLLVGTCHHHYSTCDSPHEQFLGGGQCVVPVVIIFIVMAVVSSSAFPIVCSLSQLSPSSLASPGACH